jgi:hypothetical protein
MHMRLAAAQHPAYLYIAGITAAASVGFTSSHGQLGTSARLMLMALLLL